MTKLNIKTDWDLAKMFSSITDPKIKEEKEYITQKVQELSEKWRNNSSYMTEVSVLKDALEEFEAFNAQYGSAGQQGYYLGLLEDINTADAEIKAAYNEMQEWAIQNDNQLQFFSLNLGKITSENQKKFLAAPELKKYHHFLERTFATAKYNLSEKEENLANILYPYAKENWVKFNEHQLTEKTGEIFIDGKSEVKTLGELNDLCRSPIKEIRDQAGKKFAELIHENIAIAEAEQNSILGYEVAMRKLRGATRADEFRLVSDDVDFDLVDSLLAAVSKRNSISQKFYSLKAKLLGQEKMEYYERAVEFPVMDKQMSFEDAVELAYEVFGELDVEFAKIFKEFAESGTFDVFPRKNKKTGAYCSHQAKKDPIYILLNFMGTMNDVLTLAHECGHGINDVLMKKQPEVYYGTSLGTAEVASTFMEDFMIQKFFETADKEMRLNLIMNKLNDDVSSIFRQVACYQFEQTLHKEYEEKKHVPAQRISELFAEKMAGYMGETVSLEEGGAEFWIYWPHIRRHFYVYSYASGLLISKALQNAVKHDKTYIEKVKQFLSAGLSQSPVEIFKDIGIDITKDAFWNQGLDEVESLLNEAEALAKELGKI